jgi:hypothetical protein
LPRLASGDYTGAKNPGKEDAMRRLRLLVLAMLGFLAGCLSVALASWPGLQAFVE